MNSLGSRSSTASRTYLWQVILLTVIFSLLSVITIPVYSFTLSLRWLPLIPIALWPRTAPAILSIITLLVLGVFQDWVGYDVPGQWALIYILCYAIFRPFERIKPLHFFHATLLWLGAILIALSILTLSGRLIYGIWPSWDRMFHPMLCASTIFPLFWFARQFAHVLLYRQGDA